MLFGALAAPAGMAIPIGMPDARRAGPTDPAPLQRD